jgi:hypothetical protein
MKFKICFDLDNTICTTVKNFYSKSKPKKRVINLINNLNPKKYEVIIFTSRFMGRSNDNAKKAKSLGYIFTKNQLSSWGLKYDKLLLGKPSYDKIFDDKSINFSQKSLVDFLKKKTKRDK